MATYADGTVCMIGDIVKRLERWPDALLEEHGTLVVKGFQGVDGILFRDIPLSWEANRFELVKRTGAAPSPAKAEPLVKWPEEDKTKAMAKRISDRIHNVGCWAADFVFKVVTEEMARTETPEDEYGNLEPDELFVFVDHPQFVLRKLEHNAVLIFGDVLDSFEPAAYDLKRKVRRVKVTRSPKFEVI